MLCYVRGEQLDKLSFSASHLMRYWEKIYVNVSYGIFWEIKHLNLSLIVSHAQKFRLIN